MSFDTDQPGSDRVIGHGNGDYERVMARIDILVRLEVPALILPTRVALVHGEQVAVTEALSVHESLGAVLASRGSLRAGEVVWLGMGVATALASLHRVGLAHGAIEPAAVSVTGAGVGLAQLVDGAVKGASGDVRLAQADDIAALGTMLAEAVREQDSARLRAWTDPMTHPDPAGRPSAAMVARALSSCATPEALTPGQFGVASALRRAINGDRPSVARRVPAAVALPEARRWRMRQVARSWFIKGAVAVGVAGLLVLGGVGITQAMGARASGPPVVASAEPLHDVSAAEPPPTIPSPVDAATRLTSARFEAIRSGDAASLVATTTPGSEARAAADALAGEIVTGGFVAEGLEGSVDGATLVEFAAPGGAGSTPVARVRVVYTLGAHALIRDGAREDYDPYQQTVDLLLAWDGVGDWTVSEVSDPVG